MTREKLLAKRKEALAKMKTISASENFNQEDFDNAKKDVDSISAQIQALDLEEKLKEETNEVIDSNPSNKKPDEKAKISAALAYARTGVLDAQNSVKIGGGSNGAVLIPESWSNEILTDLKKTTAIRNFATVIKTNGTFNMPIGGGTPSFDWIAEGGSYPKPDLTFTNKTLDAFKAGGIILVSEELLHDETFNLEAHLKEQMVDGISETEGPAFIEGDGTGKPKGITTDIDVDLTETLSALDSISLIDIENVYLAVPSKARKNGAWVISDKFYKAIFRMKDSTGNYIMREGQNGMPGTIFGRPFEIDDTMEGGADAPLAIFGSLKDYVIGDRGEMAMQRLDEKYADDGYVGFKIYKRTDGKLRRNKYISQLKNAES